MKLGVIGRADQGGLASLTQEVVRHLNPDRVLLMNLGLQARGGTTALDVFAAEGRDVTVTNYRGPDKGHGIEPFMQGLDVLFSAETMYFDHVYALARAHGCATVLYVMPELFTASALHATELWVPTEWERVRLPARAALVPMPVALDRFVYRQRTRCRVLFATTGEAMEDRNGWKIVVQALQHLDHPTTLLWRGGPVDSADAKKVGKVTVRWLPPVENYYDAIPPETDVLLLPRRYGGLCLPFAEAAAQGIPTVMTDLSPQNAWLTPDLMIPAHPRQYQHRMKGGHFTVHDAEPEVLAQRINMLADDRERMVKASDHARAWALANSWEVLGDEWRSRLERLA